MKCKHRREIIPGFGGASSEWGGRFDVAKGTGKGPQVWRRRPRSIWRERDHRDKGPSLNTLKVGGLKVILDSPCPSGLAPPTVSTHSSLIHGMKSATLGRALDNPPLIPVIIINHINDV